jgi:hypothetical protein
MTTLDLRVPVNFGTESITQLKIRRPKFKDVYGLPLTLGYTELGQLLEKLTNQPKIVIEELDMIDAKPAMRIVADFLADGQEIGPMS